MTRGPFRTSPLSTNHVRRSPTLAGTSTPRTTAARRQFLDGTGIAFAPSSPCDGSTARDRGIWRRTRGPFRNAADDAEVLLRRGGCGAAGEPAAAGADLPHAVLLSGGDLKMYLLVFHTGQEVMRGLLAFAREHKLTAVTSPTSAR